jgi:DNA-binding SARP family transcriptional activator
LDFRLLGPLEVVGDGGTALPIGAGRERALLGLLLLRANELVGSDQLVGELWGESPPPTAQKIRLMPARHRSGGGPCLSRSPYQSS